MSEFINIIQERRAIRHFDPTHKLQKNEIITLLEIAINAPSAWNLQHWQFLVITEQADKEKLLPITYGQKQVIDSSVTIAILGDLQANQHAENIYEQNQFMPDEVKADQLQQIASTYAHVSTFSRDEAIRNASLAAMQLMLVAKAKGLDSGPIGGYDADQLIKVFHIPARYLPVILITIGKAAKSAYPSPRLPIEEKLTWNHF